MQPERAARRFAEPNRGLEPSGEHAEFRADLERIRFSPYFSRLSAVTQVIAQPGAGPLIHNRLTHSVKVTAVARTIAVELAAPDSPARELALASGCDAVVVQAAASAHDLGHPPFGHLGERVLDRLARDTLGLADGFEGNAQSYRILATLDVSATAPRGLNLTAAVRAAVAKYPWTRFVDAAAYGDGPLPRGLRRTPGVGGAPGTVEAPKFSAYDLDAADLFGARAGLPPMQQSLECSIMDLADDIAYSIHDVDDFYRAGLLGQGAVAREFRGWTEASSELAALDAEALAERGAPPGAALDALRRKLHRSDPWIADDDAFADAVSVVADDLVDGLLATPFDGSISAERALSSFTGRWIAHLQASVVPAPEGVVRSGLVTLDRRAWHEVEVLKFVHRHFILDRADIVMYQRGLSRVLTRAVKGLAAWITDEEDRTRVPERLRELVEIAADGYARLHDERPDGIPLPDRADVPSLAVARGVVDYVASLSDDQALAVSEAIDGRPDRLWDIGQNL
ncbi:deoxyguanosinetriphosphate triphosphohydrolase family protein [Agromyces archimandritae]|uniref:DNTP triphosphohydrolase n=1 Tax=Agromyces archimandritae TaxID=2781962 RepID=A0A975IMN5_9MICO|nr:dNTP triphosphohydrolase [Agromyces archimandritae]QTX03698.1 dNTP triphosphohydrolase [Agromyces archimandritae]